MSRQHVFLFWGMMDLIYILGFVYWNIRHGRVPLYDDIASFLRIDSSYGGAMPLLVFSSASLLICSIAVTVFMFFKQHRFTRLVVCLQAPLRLFLVVPSLSFIPWLVNLIELKQVAAVFTLLLASEALKITSLWWRFARQPTSG